jgi:hypothetical protein
MRYFNYPYHCGIFSGSSCALALGAEKKAVSRIYSAQMTVRLANLILVAGRDTGSTAYMSVTGWPEAGVWYTVTPAGRLDNDFERVT